MIVQRPRTGAFARQTQYLFLEQYNSVVLSNSDLKPEKLFDYEVGFQQTVTKQSALTLSAFYKERKDMIQVRPYLFAWPKTYYTFGNRDFSTTKGLKVVYDLRRVGNLRMNLAYTLQFAEGSGSGTSSANGGSNSFVGQATVLGNFISASLPNMRFATALDYDSRHMIVANIDYRYDDGAGPAIGDVHFLENAGVNFIFSARSGEPYTRYSEPIGRTITGDLNGSRLPWHYNIDMRLDKDFKLAFGKKKEGVKPKDPLVLNAYVLVYNLMNRRDITRVNGYTGLPDDDGYLTSPNGIAFTNNQTDPQSFVDLYGISTGPNFGVGQNNPNWINLPRRVNIGLQLNF